MTLTAVVLEYLQGQQFAPNESVPMAAGTNVGTLAADGRLREVAGFFDFTPDGS